MDSCIKIAVSRLLNSSAQTRPVCRNASPRDFMNLPLKRQGNAATRAQTLNVKQNTACISASSSVLVPQSLTRSSGARCLLACHCRKYWSCGVTTTRAICYVQNPLACHLSVSRTRRSTLDDKQHASLTSFRVWSASGSSVCFGSVMHLCSLCYTYYSIRMSELPVTWLSFLCVTPCQLLLSAWPAVFPSKVLQCLVDLDLAFTFTSRLTFLPFFTAVSPSLQLFPDGDNHARLLLTLICFLPL